MLVLHRWRRRVLETHCIALCVSAQAAATAAAAVRACWLRWPCHRVALASAVARTHDINIKLRACWSRWPRMRVPPRLTAAVAKAHERVAALRRGLLAVLIWQQRRAIAEAQHTVVDHHHRSHVWSELVLALNAERVSSVVTSATVAFARRGACARLCHKNLKTHKPQTAPNQIPNRRLWNLVNLELKALQRGSGEDLQASKFFSGVSRWALVGKFHTRNPI